MSQRPLVRERRDGSKRDTTLAVEAFFAKKFGYKWRKLLSEGKIPQEDIDAANAEFREMMVNL